MKIYFTQFISRLFLKNVKNISKSIDCQEFCIKWSQVSSKTFILIFYFTIDLNWKYNQSRLVQECENYIMKGGKTCNTQAYSHLRLVLVRLESNGIHTG